MICIHTGMIRYHWKMIQMINYFKRNKQEFIPTFKESTPFFLFILKFWTRNDRHPGWGEFDLNPPPGTALRPTHVTPLLHHVNRKKKETNKIEPPIHVGPNRSSAFNHSSWGIPICFFLFLLIIIIIWFCPLGRHAKSRTSLRQKKVALFFYFFSSFYRRRTTRMR
jgi:hypothetical protein